MFGIFLGGGRGGDLFLNSHFNEDLTLYLKSGNLKERCQLSITEFITLLLVKGKVSIKP